jgi:diguanylate cyclase (GGDEF)-like protein
VLPETDAEGAAHVAAACRSALLAAQIPHETSGVAPVVTVSVGCGTIVPSDDDAATPFVGEVDKALYRAKQAGRNQIVAR